MHREGRLFPLLHTPEFGPGVGQPFPPHLNPSPEVKKVKTVGGGRGYKLTSQTSHRPDASSGLGWAVDGLEEEEEEGEGRVFPREVAIMRPGLGWLKGFLADTSPVRQGTVSPISHPHSPKGGLESLI